LAVRGLADERFGQRTEESSIGVSDLRITLPCSYL
jgi:hypothetical protein